jgi:hypothetical protein
MTENHSIDDFMCLTFIPSLPISQNDTLYSRGWKSNKKESDKKSHGKERDRDEK